MIRRLIIITLLIYLPVEYLPYIFNGVSIKISPIYILILSFIFTISILFSRRVLEFLTLKNNIAIKIIVSSLILSIVILFLDKYVNFLGLNNGPIYSKALGSIGINIPNIVLNRYENAGVASLILSIYGIIINLLVI